MSSTTAASFADLGLCPPLLATLDDLGYEEPTPVQAQTIGHLLDGRDLVGQAATGTGKTAAFTLPMLERITDGGRDGNRSGPRPPVGLIVAPTRELAMQVAEAVYTYGTRLGVRVLPVCGGQPIGRQFRGLERGVDVVVATPGRAVDLLQRGALDLDAIRTVVLDEADEMLDLGFAEDLEAILQATPDDRQTVLFSATMPARLAGLAERYLHDEVRIEVAPPAASDEAERIRQVVHMVHRRHKAAALGRVLDVEQPGAAIVFCRTRNEVDELTVHLGSRGYRAEALHGGMDQTQRDRVLTRLRDGTAELLIATDVAARGLDVDTLTHVFNYDVPAAPETYVHRIGRVGRAGRTGTAITLAEPRQRRLVQNIERLGSVRLSMERLPTVDDLQAVRIQATVDELAEAMDDDDGDAEETLAAVLDALGDVDLLDVARAAVALVHDARAGGVDDEHIPDAKLRDDRDRGGRKGRTERDGRGRNDRSERRPRDGGPRDEGPRGSIYLSAGRRDGIRPADIVGAIANEAGLPGSVVGPIRINDNHSVVGVPDGEVERVSDLLSRASVRGKSVKARRFLDKPREERRPRPRDDRDRRR